MAGGSQEEVPAGVRVQGVGGGAATLVMGDLFEARLTLVPAPDEDVVLQRCGHQPADSAAPQVHACDAHGIADIPLFLVPHIIADCMSTCLPLVCSSPY